MKFAQISLALLALFSGTAGLVSEAHADHYRPRAAYRYRTTYRHWDRGFSTYYGYREDVRQCQQSYGYGWSSTTCYDLAPTDYVYVEERVVDGGWRRVRVYREEHAVNPYVEYDIYESGSIRRVERRHFGYHSYYHTDYYSSYYYTNQTVWVSIDWDTGWGKIISGLQFVGIGASIMAESNDEVTQAIGLASVGLGSLSVSLGSKQLEEESALEKAVKSQADNTQDGTDIQ